MHGRLAPLAGQKGESPLISYREALLRRGAFSCPDEHAGTGITCPPEYDVCSFPSSRPTLLPSSGSCHSLSFFRRCAPTSPFSLVLSFLEFCCGRWRHHGKTPASSVLTRLRVKVAQLLSRWHISRRLCLRALLWRPVYELLYPK